MSNNFKKTFEISASVISILSFIISLIALPQEYKLIGYIISGLIIEVLIIYFSYSVGKRSAIISNRDSDELLLEFFKRKKAENQNAEIVRVGLALSTPLWLSNNYLTRKLVGEFVDEAASITENTNARIKILIDDLGWTNVELGLYEEAELKLKRGLELAKENSNGYYLAKGYRHLFGLNYRLGNLDIAEKYLKQAIDFTNQLPPVSKKDELIAEIYFAKSSLEHKKGNLDKSLQEIEIAHLKYQELPDKEWMIKILARKGEILLGQGKIEEASEIFRQGINASKKYHFNRQIVKNLIGLGKCLYERKELVKSKDYFDEALNIVDKIGMYYEKSIINLELAKFKHQKSQ